MEEKKQTTNSFSESSIPVIFTHTGNALYLQLALLQAKKICGNQIHLLGDNSNKADFINHHFISDYENSELYNNFKNYFKNLSPNSYDYELFCFKRWFLILEFCKKNNIKEFFCVDSDVLIYKNLYELKDILKNIDFSVIRITGKFAGPQCSYFKISSLEKYCNFILNYYQNRFNELESLYNQFKKEKNISGISDMVLLALFCEENKGKYIDFDFEEKERNFCFDENISCSAGFKMKNGIKEVTFKDGIPYCKRLENNSEIPFYMLHFQGAAKKMMEKYSTLTKAEKSESPYLKVLKRTEKINAVKKQIKKMIPQFIKKALK